jgi:metal-responsive CopG/Arc/MetJ family transcriptional regulator
MFIGIGIKRVSVSVAEKLIDTVVEIINQNYAEEMILDRDDVVEIALMDFLADHTSCKDLERG